MLLQSTRNYFKAIGKKGGKQRASALDAATRVAQARKAVVTRWMRQRFGVDRFENMGLPGWEVVDAGLRDLANGVLSSVNALAVTEVRPKLRFLGVPVPDTAQHTLKTRMTLYRMMEQQHGDMAHARFCALLERVDSFCDALASRAPALHGSPHRNRRWCA